MVVRSEDPRARSARTKKLRTQRALLDAARRRFADHGWTSTRMEDIANDAGVGVATAYLHYSKQTLIGHVYLPLFQPLVDRADREIADGFDASVAITRHVRDLARLIRRHRNLTVALVAAVHERSVASQGPAERNDPDDVRAIVPAPLPLARLIEYGQRTGQFTATVAASEVASYHTNATFLRTISRPNESAVKSANMVLSQLIPALTWTLRVPK